MEVSIFFYFAEPLLLFLTQIGVFSVGWYGAEDFNLL